MKTEQPILVTTITAKDKFSKGILVFSNGYLATEGSKPLGVSQTSAEANDLIPLTVQGIALVAIDRAVTVGEKLQAMDDGYATPYGAGEIVGYSLDAGSNAGDLVRVLLV